MTIEAGVVVDTEGQALFWHEPQDRTGGSLPDSASLWDVFWENRDKISGFAHSHPGSGLPGPSMTDVTTFAAVEAALGKRLLWWITSSNRLSVCYWVGPHRLSYKIDRVDETPQWLEHLRSISNYNQQQVEVSNGGQYHPGQ
jgi:hypothetical protein